MFTDAYPPVYVYAHVAKKRAKLQQIFDMTKFFRIFFVFDIFF